MKNKIDFIFFLYKKVFFETTMTIFYITENEENYCMAVAHFIKFTHHLDIDIIWNFYKSQETDKEACFLYTIKVLSDDDWINEEPILFEKRPKFKFINDYPVEIIEGEDDDLKEDIVRNIEDRDYYEGDDEDEYQGEYGKRIDLSEDEECFYTVPPTRFEKKI